MKKTKYLTILMLSKLVNSQSTSSNDVDDCLSLEGSVTCPAFSGFYIGLNQHQQYPFLRNITNITTFDMALKDYVSSAHLYLSPLGCTNKADMTTTIPYARYSLTFMCANLIQDTTSSLPCNFRYNISPPPLCQTTCFDYTASVNQITDNTFICPNLLEQQDQVAFLNSSCQYWSGLNGTTNCIIGLANEPDNCGFASTSTACHYCHSINDKDNCCQLISCPALSKGGIIGLVIGVFVLISMVAGILYWFCYKNKKTSISTGLYMMSDKKVNDQDSDMSSTVIDTMPATPLDEFYQVKHPYPPKMGDELGLQRGDIICMAMNFDDGWALGFNVTSGSKGVFPLVCVSPAPQELLEQLLLSEQTSRKSLIQDRKLRDSIQRSISRSSKRLINVSELTHHQGIPRRTASMMRKYDHNIETSTIHTPLVHPEPALFQPNETFEMYNRK